MGLEAVLMYVLPDSGTHTEHTSRSRLLRFGKETLGGREEGDCQAPLKARGNWPPLSGHIVRKPDVHCEFISY